MARWLPHERRPLPHPHHAHTLRSQLAPMFQHLRNPHLLATYAVGFNVLFSLVGVFTYITFYLSDPPFRLSTAALSYLFVVYLIGLFVTPAAGYVITRVGLLRGIVTAIAISMLGVLITLIPSLPFVILGLALCSTGVFISQASATSYLREAAPEGGRVSAAGFYLSCYYIGGTAAGVVPSFFWHLGWLAGLRRLHRGHAIRHHRRRSSSDGKPAPRTAQQHSIEFSLACGVVRTAVARAREWKGQHGFVQEEAEAGTQGDAAGGTRQGRPAPRVSSRHTGVPAPRALEHV